MLVPASEIITRGGRIVGGQSARNNQIPFQVLIQNGNSICGGCIINERWVLSAAHCTVSANPMNTRITVGALNRFFSGVQHAVARIVNHPQYQPLPYLANDVCVLQTARQITFNNAVQPISLGSAYIGAGITAVASGWGATAWPGTAPANLQFISLRTITNEDCIARHNNLNPRNTRAIHNNVLCTFNQSGQGVCGGNYF